jgi:hypothetical protein
MAEVGRERGDTPAAQDGAVVQRLGGQAVQENPVISGLVPKN